MNGDAQNHMRMEPLPSSGLRYTAREGLKD